MGYKQIMNDFFFLDGCINMCSSIQFNMIQYWSEAVKTFSFKKEAPCVCI